MVLQGAIMLSPKPFKQYFREQEFVKSIGKDIYKASSWLWFVIHFVSTLLRRRAAANEKQRRF